MNITFNPSMHASSTISAITGPISVVSADEISNDSFNSGSTPFTTNATPKVPVTLQPVIDAENSSSSESFNDSSDDEEDDNFTGLHKLCYSAEGENDPAWSKVLDLLQQLKEQGEREIKEAVEREQKGVIPLMIACEQQPPVKVIKALIEASPKTLQYLDEQDFLPLHTACSNDACEDVIRMLVEKDPRPETVKEALTGARATPLHLLMYENNVKLPSLTLFKTLISPLVMEVEDEFGNTPQKLLFAHVEGVQNLDYMDQLKAQKHCKAIFDIYLDVKPNDKNEHMDLVKEVQNFPSWLQNHCLQHIHVKRVLNHRVSQRKLTAILMLDIVIQVMIVATFITAMESALPKKVDTSHHVHIVILSVGIFYKAFWKLIRFPFASFGFWLSDTWNWLEILQIVFVILTILLLNNDSLIDPFSQMVLTITGGLVWICLVAICRAAFLPICVFISGIMHLVYILFPFMITIFCILGAFAVMFFIIINTSIESLEWCTTETLAEISFCTLNGSFLKLYQIIIGDVEMSEFTSRYIRILYPICTFVVVILLLNALVVVLNHSFKAVIYESCFWSRRLQFVNEVEDAIEFLRRGFCCFIPGSPMSDNNVIKEFPDSSPTNHTTRRKKTPGYDVKNYLNYARSGKIEERVDSMRLLWDILIASFAHHRDPRQWTKEEEILYRCNNLMYKRLMDKSLFLRRFIAIHLVPLWFILGAITFGFLWPPQMREALFCPILTADTRRILYKTNDIHLDNAMKNAVQGMNNRVRELENELTGIRNGIKTMQTDVAEEMETIKKLLLLLTGSPASSASNLYHIN